MHSDSVSDFLSDESLHKDWTIPEKAVSDDSLKLFINFTLDKTDFRF